MQKSGPSTQPKCDPRQHHGRIDCRNAQDHRSLSVRPYSPPPPRRPQQQQCSLQHPPVSYYPVQGMPQPTYHARATMPMPAQQPGQGMMNSVGCRTAIPSTKCRERADDTTASSAGDANDGTLIFSQPTTLLCPQPAAAGILLTSRGGQ